MTATQTETRTRHALWFKPADSLIRALTNGLLFAGTDMTLPMLAAVKFEFDGTDLEALSTDRYRACIEKVALDPQIDHRGQPPFEFLLPRDSAKAALAFLKGNRRDPVTLTFDADTRIVRLEALASSVEYATIDNKFPPIRSLFPSIEDVVAVDRLSFTPKLLADMGKVLTGSQSLNGVTIRTFGEHKPSLIEFGEGPRVLLMPLRLPA